MSVLYNIDPFRALNIVYHGVTDGFPEEDFERNEQERGLFVPQILKNFLRRYGYASVNRLSDSVRILHPNLMSERVFTYEDGRQLYLLIIGRVGEFQVGISNHAEYDPEIFLLKVTHDETQILPSDDTISEIFKVMTCGVLIKTNGARIVDDPAEAVKMLRDNGIDLDLIGFDPKLRREYSICYSEERRAFVAAEYVEGSLARFFYSCSEEFYEDHKQF